MIRKYQPVCETKIIRSLKQKWKHIKWKQTELKKNTVIRNQVLHTRAETSGTEAEVGLNFVGFYATLATRLGRRPIDIT